MTFLNLHINGELYGLYVGIEAVDNRFLNRDSGGHGGNLYEAGLDATLTPEMDLETMEQKKGKDESKADVAELIRVLDEMPLGEKGGIERVLDVDGVLRTMAANAVLHNWDDYAGVFCHNYYLYAENGFFHLIPWDMNETFLQTGPMYRPSGGSRQDIATPIIGNVDPKERPLATKLMAVPEYYERYLEYCDTLRQWLETLPVTPRALSERIAPDVESDPTKFYSYEDFGRQFDSAYHDGLAGFIEERAEYLLKRLPELMESALNFYWGRRDAVKIKRKLDGVVYKRRVEAAPSVLRDFPENGSSLQAACQVAGTGASASGHTVTVAQAGRYSISGVLGNGQISANAGGDDVVVQALNGMEISHASDAASI